MSPSQGLARGLTGTPRPLPAGLSLSDLVRRAVGRVHTWTAAHADLERDRNRELAQIGNNLNQIARWTNTHIRNRRGGRSHHPSRRHQSRPQLVFRRARRGCTLSSTGEGQGSAAEAADYLTAEKDASRHGLETLCNLPSYITGQPSVLPTQE